MKIKITLVSIFLLFLSGCTAHRIYYEVPGHPEYYHYETVYTPGTSVGRTTTYYSSPYSSNGSYHYRNRTVYSGHSHYHPKKKVIVKKYYPKKKVVVKKYYPKKKVIVKKHYPKYKKKKVYKKKYKKKKTYKKKKVYKKKYKKKYIKKK